VKNSPALTTLAGGGPSSPKHTAHQHAAPGGAPARGRGEDAQRYLMFLLTGEPARRQDLARRAGGSSTSAFAPAVFAAANLADGDAPPNQEALCAIFCPRRKAGENKIRNQALWLGSRARCHAVVSKIRKRRPANARSVISVLGKTLSEILAAPRGVGPREPADPCALVRRIQTMQITEGSSWRPPPAQLF